MKICFFLISNGWGGAENVVYNLAEKMSKRNNKISIILNDETYPNFVDLKDVELYNIGNTQNLREIIGKNFKLSLSRIKLNKKDTERYIRFIIKPIVIYLNYRKMRMKVNRILVEENPDIIHLHNPISLKIYSYIYKNVKNPSVYTAHGLDFKRKGKLSKRKKRNLMSSFDIITTVSNNLKNHLYENNVKNKVKFLPNGIDISYFERIRKKNGTDLCKDQLKIMFPGGIKENKGGEILLKSLKEINQDSFNIKLYYSGINNEEFIRKNNAENITFTGLLEHKEYISKLNKCDCLIMASNIEQFPISILEGMALGKIIITTPVGGIPDFCKNKRNAIYIKRNEKDIKNKILEIYNNKKLRRDFYLNNIKDIEKYNWDNIIDDYLEIYKEIIRKK